ncbi:hypothetical protein KDA_48770 [Dictyobacter alpinus]|uniref:Uncharacterized protein n=1 Tax=Dictyobacter alpinus TaxID=2014873 RepID=A0A402BDB3_9CHLR|nr:hypothetical protein [Dictyobacter alpinus]GCE29393.1 hypothetical protein KDA_48770 [Dictyobacter alpinus]
MATRSASYTYERKNQDPIHFTSRVSPGTNGRDAVDATEQRVDVRAIMMGRMSLQKTAAATAWK